MVEYIIMGFEVTAGLVCGLVGGVQLYQITKNFKKIRDYQAYKNYLT